jgi:hypothetical protein
VTIEIAAGQLAAQRPTGNDKTVLARSCRHCR